MENYKGIYYKITTCDFCRKTFQETDIFILFKCGHILHKDEFCCTQNKECRICYIEKEKMTIGSFDKQKENILISKNEIKNNDTNKSKENEIKNKNDEKKSKINMIYNKMNNIENNFHNINSYKNIDVEKIKKSKNKNDEK